MKSTGCTRPPRPYEADNHGYCVSSTGAVQWNPALDDSERAYGYENDGHLDYEVDSLGSSGFTHAVRMTG